MQVIVRQYFKDARGEWHQPGNRTDFPDDEVEGLEKSGAIKIVRTAMLEGPSETRGENHEAHHENIVRNHRKYRSRN